MKKVPVRLENDSIVDCMVEMRFKAKSDNVANVLPGILYSKFDGHYSSTDSTAESQIPKELRVKDPGLKYRPLVNLRSDKEKVGIGDSNISITFRHPYPGWEEVEVQAIAIFQEAMDTGLITEVERLSVKYQNIIDIQDNPDDLSPLDIDLRIGTDLDFRGPGTLIRREIDHDGAVSIIQITTAAIGRILDSNDKVLGEKVGIAITVDTIKFGHISNDKELRESLRLVHDNEKATFFSLLKPETVKKMSPIWE